MSQTALREVAADGPLLVFGGPYSNLQATRAVLDEAARRGIPAERVICTGDVVAYGGVGVGVGGNVRAGVGADVYC